MSANWPRVKILNVCELIVDCVNKTAPHVSFETPYKMIRTPNIKNGRVSRVDCRFVEKETYEKWTRRAKVLFGDVLLTREAPMGQVGYVDFDDTVFLGQRIMQYRANPELLDPRYLLYAFLSDDLQHQFYMHEGSGSVVSHIRVPDCSKFELSLPPIDEQKRIVKILGDIDKKIQLNHQTNQTLEQIAQAIFKSWFVDFEPVKAKIQAKQEWAKRNLTTKNDGNDENSEAIFVERAAMRAISGKTDEQLDQLDRETLKQLKLTASLFPDELEESELGEVPRGWEVSNIGHEFDVTMGQSPPSETYNEIGEGVVFFQGRRDFGWRYPTNRVYCTAPKRLAKQGDTLLSVRAPVGDVNKSTSDCCIGRGVSALRHKSGCEAYTYYSMQRLKQHFNSFDSEGTVFGSINQKDLKAIKVVKVDSIFLMEFTRIVSPVDNEIKMLDEQTYSLSLIRDTLLPRLLSGELSIPQTKQTDEMMA